MTSAFFSRRAALLAAASVSLLISACGGGKNDNGASYIRALNLSSDVASADVWVNSTKQFGAQAAGALSGYASFDSGTYTLSVRKAGEAAALFTNSFALSKDRHYTAVVWGRESSLRLSTLPEDEDTTVIPAGNTRVRVFNATVDTGTLDVFLTTPTANLGDTAVTQGALAGGTLSGFREMSAGTYRLRVTGPSSPNDVRLDIPAVKLDAGTYNSLVITAGAGGVLVNGSLIVQQGAATPYRSQKARVRLAAGVADSASVSATVDGKTVSAAVTSPRVGGYVLVDSSATANISVIVDGGAPIVITRELLEGADYTVMAYKTPADPQVTTLLDDNRLPGTSTRAKLRLVNGVYDAGALTLSLDDQPLQPSDIGLGLASDYYFADASTAAKIEVSSLTTAGLFTQEPASTTSKLLQGQSVYTVFMFGRAADKKGVFSRDR